MVVVCPKCKFSLHASDTSGSGFNYDLEQLNFCPCCGTVYPDNFVKNLSDLDLFRRDWLRTWIVRLVILPGLFLILLTFTLVLFSPGFLSYLFKFVVSKTVGMMIIAVITILYTGILPIVLEQKAKKIQN